MLTQYSLTIAPNYTTLHCTHRKSDGTTITTTATARYVGPAYVVTCTREITPPPCPTVTREARARLLKLLGAN